MRQFTLRKNLAFYMEQNKSKYFLLILALIAGLTAGVLFSCAVGGEDSASLSKTLSDSFLNIETKSKWAILFSFFEKNLRCIVAVIIGTISVYFLPILFINIGLWGFSIGFTTSFITQSFGFYGLLMSLSLILTQVIIMLPLALLLSVTAIDYTLHNIKHKNNGIRKNRKKFLLLCILIFAILMLFSLVDVFVVPKIIKSVSALL